MIDPTSAAFEAARIFERLGIPYALGGSIASALLGEPRTTMDADFAVHLGLDHVEPLIAACEGKFLVQRESVLEAIGTQHLFNLIHLPDYVRVDVHVGPRYGLHKAEIDRARWMRLSRSSEDEIRVVTAEAIVLQKLLWFRAAGESSDRQWRDIKGVLKARRGGLDLGYLRRWGREEGLTDLLERVLRESAYPGFGAQGPTPFA